MSTQYHFWKRKKFLWVLVDLWFGSMALSMGLHLGFSLLCLFFQCNIISGFKKDIKTSPQQHGLWTKMERTEISGMRLITVARRFMESIRALTFYSVMRSNNLNKPVNFLFRLYFLHVYWGHNTRPVLCNGLLLLINAQAKPQRSFSLQETLTSWLSVTITVCVTLGDWGGWSAFHFRVLFLGSCPFRNSRDRAVCVSWTAKSTAG